MLGSRTFFVTGRWGIFKKKKQTIGTKNKKDSGRAPSTQ